MQEDFLGVGMTTVVVVLGGLVAVVMKKYCYGAIAQFIFGSFDV